MFTHIQYRSRVTLHLAGVTRLARASHSTIYARVFGECCFLCPIMHTSETCVNGESDFFCLENVLYFCNSIGEDEDNVKRSKVHSRPSNLLYPCKVFSSSSTSAQFTSALKMFSRQFHVVFILDFFQFSFTVNRSACKFHSDIVVLVVSKLCQCFCAT